MTGDVEICSQAGSQIDGKFTYKLDGHNKAEVADDINGKKYLDIKVVRTNNSKANAATGEFVFHTPMVGFKVCAVDVGSWAGKGEFV